MVAGGRGHVRGGARGGARGCPPAPFKKFAPPPGMRSARALLIARGDYYRAAAAANRGAAGGAWHAEALDTARDWRAGARRTDKAARGGRGVRSQLQPAERGAARGGRGASPGGQAGARVGGGRGGAPRARSGGSTGGGEGGGGGRGRVPGSLLFLPGTYSLVHARALFFFPRGFFPICNYSFLFFSSFPEGFSVRSVPRK